MATSNTQRPSQGTTYSTASNAGKSGSVPPTDETLKDKKPLRDDIDEEQDDTDDEDLETENKEWK